MSTWYLDEGLVVFRRQWWDAHPGATVYTIGDGAHSQDPAVSQHAPDRGTSGRPGDSKGEVDAVDVMPGKGVDGRDLDDLFEDLRTSRDPRILYVIYRDEIVSSVVSPWKLRKYSGTWHSHVHLSVNDDYSANRAVWNLGGPMGNPPLIDVGGRLPRYVKGMEDAAFDGYDGIKRAQRMLNWLESKQPDLDPDGVFGAKTAAKLKAFMAGSGVSPTTGNGSVIGEPEWRRLFGIYQPIASTQK